MTFVYIGIYLLLGIIPGNYIANKAYNKFKETHDQTMHEARFKFIAKSIDSIVYGLAFILGTLLFPLSLIEMIGDHKK
jgi:hypothetical protein